MSKKFIYIFLFLVFTLSFISFTSAVKPTNTIIASTGGIEISYPNPYIIENGQNLSVRFWAYNKTSGQLLGSTIGTTLTCTYNLMNVTGRNSVKLTTTPVGSGEIRFGGLGATACANCFNLEIDGGNFTHNGFYQFQIRCNSSTLGGYLTGDYEVTKTGLEIPEKINTTFLILLLSLSFLTLIISFIFKNGIFSFFSGIMFFIVGIYGMIYGFADNPTLTLNLYTRMISLILIGFGAIITILSAFELADAASPVWEGEDD